MKLAVTIQALAVTAMMAVPASMLAQTPPVTASTSPYSLHVPTTRPGPNAARISGVMGKPGQELFGVRFVQINGVNIQPRADLWLEPGSYTIRVLVDAAHNKRSVQRRFRSHTEGMENLEHTEIELELEANRTYEIRARFDPQKDSDIRYNIVLHQVLER